MLTITGRNKKNWYVLKTRPKAEKQVSKCLTDINIENYLPLHKKLRTWHDRRKWVEVPLFTSYLFVFIEDRLRSNVFAVSGIVKYLSIAGKVSVLREEEIERIKILSSYLGEIEIEKCNPKVGEEVEIKSGHFAGIRGRIVSTNDKLKFRIAIPGLASYATVEIDKSHVEKA